MAADMKSTPWADQPFKLITTPSKYKDVVSALVSCQLPTRLISRPQNSHSSVYCASEMAYSHNCLLRGLNSIMLQAPAITESGQSGYKSEDVQDLLFFVESWVKTVDHHHHTEETTMFPMIEEMAGSPGLLSGPQHQHEEFHDGLESLGQYAAKTQGSPADYKWETMKKIIDGFAPSLTQHLYEEIDVFLSFDRLDSAGLRVCWDKAEEVAKANGKIAFLVCHLILANSSITGRTNDSSQVRHLPLCSRLL